MMLVGKSIIMRREWRRIRSILFCIVAYLVVSFLLILFFSCSTGWRMSLQMWFGLLGGLSAVYICEQITHTIMDIFLFVLIFDAFREPLNPLVLSDFLIYDPQEGKIQAQLFVLERKNGYLHNAKLRLFIAREEEQHIYETPIFQREIHYDLLRGMVQTTFDITEGAVKKICEENSDYHFDLWLTGTDKKGCPICTKKTYSRKQPEEGVYRFKVDNGTALHEYAYYNAVMINKEEKGSRNQLYYSGKCKPREADTNKWGWWWKVKNHLLTYRYYG